jgi:hypothetical protein
MKIILITNIKHLGHFPFSMPSNVSTAFGCLHVAIKEVLATPFVRIDGEHRNCVTQIFSSAHKSNTHHVKLCSFLQILKEDHNVSTFMKHNSIS